jgi:hypothetical protein
MPPADEERLGSLTELLIDASGTGAGPAGALPPCRIPGTPFVVQVSGTMPAPSKEEHVAHYLLSVHTVAGEAREPMTDAQMQNFMRKIGELEEEMTEANALVYSGRLADADAVVVRVERGEAITTDGPFAETKEQIGGFYIVNANGLEEALSWAAKTSACVARPIEVRPFVGLRSA